MTEAHRFFYFERDLHIPQIDLWLDSKRVKPFGFISHAHTDHLARHKKVLCSPPTAELAKKRLKSTEYQVLPFGQPWQLDDFTISLHPAGHILGSAQIRLQRNGHSLLYTGDFALNPSFTAEPFELVPADVVIMETTFGRDTYRIPPRKQVAARLVERCRQLLFA
ncbi:MAG: DNA ligase, partial [Calditrichaeota bacterium]